jgi:small-conductance mechanosensitive channel
MNIQQYLSQAQALFDQRLSFRITAAALFFLAGWIFSCWLAKKLSLILERTNINNISKGTQLNDALVKKNININLPKFLGEILKWSILLVALMISTDIAGLQQVSGLFISIIKFLPNIYISLFILFAALSAENFSQKIIIGNIEGEKIVYSKILGKIARFSIRILAILAILYQLNIAQALVLSIFIAFLATLALAIGISFGIGGKDMAKKILDEIKNKLS